jgi:hypothetical protein
MIIEVSQQVDSPSMQILVVGSGHDRRSTGKGLKSIVYEEVSKRKEAIRIKGF